MDNWSTYTRNSFRIIQISFHPEDLKAGRDVTHSNFGIKEVLEGQRQTTDHFSEKQSVYAPFKHCKNQKPEDKIEKKKKKNPKTKCIVHNSIPVFQSLEISLASCSSSSSSEYHKQTHKSSSTHQKNTCHQRSTEPLKTTAEKRIYLSWSHKK